jgi:hypothetical protein
MRLINGGGDFMNAWFCALISAALMSCLAAEENLGAGTEAIEATTSSELETSAKEDGPQIQSCGNLRCEAGERPETCPSDCSICGDGICYPHESGFCPEDCCYSTPEECGG